MFTISKLLLKVIITVQVFNWSLAEIDLMLPGVEEYAKSTLEQIEIPTHNEIAELLSEDGKFNFADLGTKIDSFLVDILSENQTANLSDNIPQMSGDLDESIDDLKKVNF